MKNPIIQFMLWAMFLSYPAYAQEAIQIEIDSAPVEVEIQKPTTPEPAPPASQETTGQQTVEAPQAVESEEETADSGLSRGQSIGIAVGAAVAAGLALLAGGGGGGSGGGSSTPSHP